MYLLNNASISTAIEAGGLSIGQPGTEQLAHTFYYVRLGFRVEHSTPDGWQLQEYREGDTRDLLPGECYRVRSRESFKLSARVLGIFGSTSDLAREGVALLHGPFIDPLYPSGSADDADLIAPLWLTLVNHSRRPFELVFGHTEIAKLCLFDVSDTYPVTLAPGSPTDRKFKDRREDG